MLCLTGLPLIFGDEIDAALNPHAPYENLPADTPMANLDSIVQITRTRYPHDVLTYVFIDDDEPQIIANLSSSWQKFLEPRSDSSHYIRFDARTGKVLEDASAATASRRTFIQIMLDLHRGMFLDLPGELFLGFMGLLFILALVSGIFIYSPFMKKMEFGTIRKHRSKRLKWLDLHNLLGIVTLAWMGVVGLTGIMNELSTPLFGIWQLTDVKAMLKPYKGKPVPTPDELHSLQAAFDTAQLAVPQNRISSLVFPGSPFGSPQHYLIWTKGNSTLRSRLFNPILVDARDGSLTKVVTMPGYLRALEVSRPLHFGDYGGLPLKIIWTIFDLITIVVLISGFYLWWARRKLKFPADV